MTRSPRYVHIVLAAFVAAVFFSASAVMASASHSYDYDNYDYDSYSYSSSEEDNSIHNSFNNHDSNNVYAYVNGSYSYDRPYYSETDRSYRYYDHDYGRDHDRLQKPSCSIWISGYGGTYGYDRTIQISWTSSYATNAYISNVGSVGANGSQAIYHPYDDRYTMTVYGQGGTDTCTTQYVSSGGYEHRYYGDYANYAPDYAYAPVQYRYIALKQIPYTGFDFGLFGNALYWLAMMLVAMTGAYLIVYSHSGQLPRAYLREVALAARNQIRFIGSFLG